MSVKSSLETSPPGVGGGGGEPSFPLHATPRASKRACSQATLSQRSLVSRDVVRYPPQSPSVLTILVNFGLL